MPHYLQEERNERQMLNLLRSSFFVGKHIETNLSVICNKQYYLMPGSIEDE